MISFLNRIRIENVLRAAGIRYQTYHHQPVFKVSDSLRLGINLPGLGTKSLFLKTNDGKYYLLLLPGQRRANLEKVATYLKVKKLSFASEEELLTFLAVKPGSVSPLALLNDKKKKVKLIVDNDVYQAKLINFHPNDNRASIVIDKSNFHLLLKNLIKRYDVFAFSEEVEG